MQYNALFTFGLVNASNPVQMRQITNFVVSAAPRHPGQRALAHRTMASDGRAQGPAIHGAHGMGSWLVGTMVHGPRAPAGGAGVLFAAGALAGVSPHPPPSIPPTFSCRFYIRESLSLVLLPPSLGLHPSPSFSRV